MKENFVRTSCALARSCLPNSLILTFVWLVLSSCPAPGQRLASVDAPAQTQSLHLHFLNQQAQPLSMVTGDFDEDGIGDLVIGYGLPKGGSIAFLRGNLDAHAPQSRESWLAASRHQYSDPYLQIARPVPVPMQPALMISADVDGDGHLDLIYANKGSNLINVMFGDGKGNFSSPVSMPVTGGVTALAAYRPGAPLLGEAIIAGYQTNQGARLAIISYSSNTFTTRATYVLPGRSTSMSIANLDADMVPDTAVVAGGQLIILHGKNAISGSGEITTVPISDVESVTVGEFLFDRHPQLQLSVLTFSGDVVILAHQGFDPTPYSPQEIAAKRHRQANQQSAQMSAQEIDNTGGAPWIEVERHTTAAAHPASGRPPIIVRSRSAGGFDDLVVLDTVQQQQTVISHSVTPPRNFSTAQVILSAHVAAGRFSSSSVVAALSASVSPDIRNGLVVLNSNSLSPDITVPAAGNTFFVNTTADNTGTTTDSPDFVRCSNGSTETCTLRDAITYANNDATDNLNAGTSDTIMVPAGTYNLTWQAGSFDPNGNALTHLEIFGPVTVIGVSGSTIINGNNNDVVFSINPGPFGSFTGGISNVFSLALENLTVKNGTNKNQPATGFHNSVSGCINWDADSTGNLTITNSTITNCTAGWGQGGGIWATNSAGGGTGTLTLNNDVIENNATSEVGGGVDMFSSPPALSATNTTFSGNKADTNVNTSDPNSTGAGGGLYIDARGGTATPQSTLANVTITSNTAAQVDGGGILTNSGMLISSSLFKSNSAARLGGGLFSEVQSPETQTTVTSSNFLSNSAATDGGGISGGTATKVQGNILQVGLSRIFGNASTSGASGLAAGSSGNTSGEVIATDNWWGCNGGPTTIADGCDQAVIYDATNGSLTTAPYAQLGFSSDITTIPPGGSMNLAVSLNTGSDGNPITGAFPAVATNYPYSYNVTGVTANPALTTGTFDTSGVGTAMLTPSTTGNGSVSVTFDNQTDTIDFTAQAKTATSLAISANPSLAYLYGQPSRLTVQLTPSSATGITASDFTVTVDSSSTGYSIALISNNNYQISGPFNALPPGGHTLTVSFVGTTDFANSNTSTMLNVSAGTVTISDTVTPSNLVQGQGGTVTVTVAGVGTGAVPTGSVTYAFNGGSSQTDPLSGGVATITIPTIIPTGNNSISLTYSGDGNYASASTSPTVTIFGKSQTTISSLTATAAQINVFGFGFTAPSGMLAFNDVTSGSPVTGPVTLNTSSSTPSLLPQVTTSTGVNSLPVWTELVDLNGDGILDLVTSVFGTDSLTIQLGNGDGTFGAATSILIASGFGPSEVHAASLRGSSTLDLIVGSFNTNQIAVLLGNGNGTFQPPTFYTVGTATNAPTSLTTGDFNHDGNLDVAVANTGDNTISILTGNGSGSLAVAGSAITVGRGPEAIRAADFNGDAYSDLTVANYHDGTISILLNNQNGTFSASIITAGTGPQALAITGSGSSQLLAVANFGSNNISVLKNNGMGTFTAQASVNAGNGPDEVRFADINGDSIPDLIIANYTDGTLNVAIGNTAAPYIVLGPFAIGTKPYSAAAGDLDENGTPDIVVANCFSNNTGVLLSGTQISVPYTALSLPAGNVLNATYSPDVNSKYGASTSPGMIAP